MSLAIKQEKLRKKQKKYEQKLIDKKISIMVDILKENEHSLIEQADNYIKALSFSLEKEIKNVNVVIDYDFVSDIVSDSFDIDEIDVFPTALLIINFTVDNNDYSTSVWFNIDDRISILANADITLHRLPFEIDYNIDCSILEFKKIRDFING